MSPAVAKIPRKTDADDDDAKRGRGRPPTDIDTGGLSCRAPVLMIAAYKAIQELTGTKPGTSLLRAAEEYLIRFYRDALKEPKSGLFKKRHYQPFLDAVEEWLKEANLWPLPPE